MMTWASVYSINLFNQVKKLIKTQKPQLLIESKVIDCFNEQLSLVESEKKKGLSWDWLCVVMVWLYMMM